MLLPRLHPDVQVTVRPDDVLELLDRRTDLLLALESTADAGERLSQVLDELGLLDSPLPRDEVLRRQRDFRQAQAAQEQRERLSDLLARVRVHVPYYRARQDEYSVHVVDASDVRQLPLLARAEVQQGFPDLLATDVDLHTEMRAGRLELFHTSGSTDEQLQAICDMQLDRIPTDYLSDWGLDRLGRTPRTAVFTSPTCMGPTCSAAGASFGTRLVHGYTLYLPSTRDLFSISDDQVRAIVGELERFAPDLLFVNPVYAHWLGRRIRELGLTPPSPRLILTSYQLLSGIQERALTQLFGAPVRNLYSATELGGCQIGLECAHGNLHVREDHCLVEVLPEQLPHGLAEQGLGAVVVTTLAGRAMPLVRYLVGDLAVQRRSECPCAMGDWPVLQLHGRIRELLRLAGVWVTPRQLDTVISGIAGIDFYQMRQGADGTLALMVVPTPGGDISKPLFRDTLQQRFGVDNLEIHIRRRLDTISSLKFPPVLSSGRV